MKRFATAGILAALSIALASPAMAVTCTLNIEQAYQKAVSNGWKFDCFAGVLSFNNQKQVGCLVKTGAQLKVNASAHFFSYSGHGQTFFNGWRLDSFKMSGGQYSKHSPSEHVVRASFEVKGPFKTGSRYLAELRLRKDGGSCSNVLNQAF